MARSTIATTGHPFACSMRPTSGRPVADSGTLNRALISASSSPMGIPLDD